MSSRDAPGVRARWVVEEWTVDHYTLVTGGTRLAGGGRFVTCRGTCVVDDGVTVLRIY